MNSRNLLPVLLAVFLVISASFSSAAELCYVGDKGHIYIHKIIPLTGVPQEMLSGKDKRITPQSLTGGVCRMPQWLDRDRIVFIYDLSPDSTPAKTKVGILNLKTSEVKWIPLLAGSVCFGYDKGSNSLDFMKTLKKNPDSDAFEVYLGQYGLSTGKAKSAPAFKGYGSMYPKPVYRWPDATLRLIPIATSDVSDQLAVYSPAKKKFVEVKWLQDKWKTDHLGGWATIAMAPGPSRTFAMAVFGGQGELTCTLSRTNLDNDAITRVRRSPAIIRGPAFSSDGKQIAWWEESMRDRSLTVWVSPLMEPEPVKLASGRDPAWRP